MINTGIPSQCQPGPGDGFSLFPVKGDGFLTHIDAFVLAETERDDITTPAEGLPDHEGEALIQEVRDRAEQRLNQFFNN